MSYELHYGIYTPSESGIWWWEQRTGNVWTSTSEAVAEAQLVVVKEIIRHNIPKWALYPWTVVCIEKWHREREGERLRREQEIAQVKLEEYDGNIS